MLAIIKTGGKQYLVSPKDKIKIEKIDKNEGEEIEFDQVLLLEENGVIKIGKPYLEGIKVIGKILKQEKGKKIRIIKFKRRTRYLRRKGHRQFFTEVEILNIGRTNAKTIKKQEEKRNSV